MTDPPAGKKLCAKCNGTQVIMIDDLTVEPCVCLRAKLFKQHLGAEIALAPTIVTSPLFQLGPEGQLPSVDRTTENLFIKGEWADILSHLKWALYCKGLKYRFRVVTDERIRTIFVGAEAYTARNKKQRDDMQTFNTLADLVGVEFELIVIRLGFLGHKNIAAAGAFKEALMLREVLCKPTWIVEVPSSIFGPGHLTYSDDVGDYIDNHFEVLTIKPSTSERSSRPVVAHGVAAPVATFVDDGEDVSLSATTPALVPFMPKPRIVAPTRPAYQPEPEPERHYTDRSESKGDSGLGALEGGDRKRKYNGGRKKPSGGGPL